MKPHTISSWSVYRHILIFHEVNPRQDLSNKTRIELWSHSISCLPQLSKLTCFAILHPNSLIFSCPASFPIPHRHHEDGSSELQAAGHCPQVCSNFITIPTKKAATLLRCVSNRFSTTAEQNYLERLL